jgi:glycosyltransferase involved in cell wall biosynthesis
MLEHIRRAGVGVQMVAPLRRDFKYMFLAHKAVGRLTGRGVQIDRHPLALRSYARQIGRQLAQSNVDAIFAPSSIPVSALDTRTPILFWGDAVIDSMCDYYPGAFARMGARNLDLARNQEQAALEKSRFAIYASEWAANSVRKHYNVNGDQIQVIPFGANLAIRHSRPDISHFIEQRLARQCRLLFIGVDWERKGGPTALETVEILNQRGVPATLTIVGTEAPDSPFVERLGFISKSTIAGQQRLSELLQSSTFFLLPTRAEAAGIVFCEASAFGLPIVSTNTGGVGTYVVDGSNGLLLPMHACARDYADGIERLWKDRSLYRKISLNGFDEYEQRLNWDVAIQRLLQLVQTAVAERATSGRN